MGKALSIMLVLTIFGPNVIMLFSFHAVPVWSIQTIATKTSVFGYCPIALDSGNNPHIAYGGAYSSWNGSAWNTQKLANGTVYDLALDKNNNPHILLDGADRGLLYATWTEQNWITQTVDRNSTRFGRFGALVLDSAGNPHIAYTDDYKLVKYASKTGANWDIQTIDTSQSDYAPRVSIAVDANNTINLVYGSAADVKLAAYTNSTWRIQTVASDMDSLGNIVLDSKGYPHLIYARDFSESYPPNIAIVYASWDGAAWNSQKAVSNVTTGGVGTRGGFFTMGCLLLDSHDNPHIAYVNDFASVPFGWGNLVYASWTGKTWDAEKVNSTILAQSCYLALDSDDNPQISFMGVTDGSEEALLTGAYTWISPVMYATAAMSSATEPTETAILTAVIIVLFIAIATVAILLVYLKKRHKPKSV